MSVSDSSSSSSSSSMGAIRAIAIRTLEKPLIRGTVSSRYDIARLEKVARADPANLPGIRVGIIGGKYYPMGRFDVLAACRAAAVHEVRADLRNYDSKLDLMTDQMREVSVGEYIDPLHIRDVINEFGRCGVPAGGMLEMANLADTPSARVAASMITDDVLKALADFVDTELSGKLPAASLVVPAHILLRISRMEPEMQAVIANRVTELTFPQPEMSFAWPPPLSLAYEIRNTSKPEKKSDAVVVSTTKMDGPKPKNAKPKTVKVSQEHAEMIENLRRTSKDCMIILDKKGAPKLLVNKKDNTVCCTKIRSA